ncbi:MAG: hypothetical protein AAB561_01480 [Patescibacteria group bacterium]
MLKEKLKLRWAILCSGTSTDQKSNNISLFGITDQLNIKREFFNSLPENKKGYKIVPIKFELVTLWDKGSIENEIKFIAEVSFNDSNNKEVSKMTKELIIPSGMLRNRFVVNINALGIQKEGDYSFNIKALDPKSKGLTETYSTPLTVTLKD